MDIKVPAVWTNTEFVVDGNTIWFVPYEYCFLYQYDFIQKRVCTKIFWKERRVCGALITVL